MRPVWWKRNPLLVVAGLQYKLADFRLGGHLAYHFYDAMLVIKLTGTKSANGLFRMRCENCGMDRMCAHAEETHYCGVVAAQHKTTHAEAPAEGPGTELKALLKTIGITASPTCSCNKRARIMDEKGCDWCEEHIDEIDGWLAEEAKKRKLPYISAVGKTLIRLAIRRARKKGNGR